MTPGKEIFVKVQEQLKTITDLELVDLDRKQFENKQSDNYAGCFTAALIKYPNINYESMTEQQKEGTAEIEILLYCKDGWMHQHQNTADPNNGLTEIDLIDSIVEALEGLYGDAFTSLEQTNESENEIADDELISFSIKFSTRVYKYINKKYSSRSLTITTA
jgi:hypothetical protein